METRHRNWQQGFASEDGGSATPVRAALRSQATTRKRVGSAAMARERATRNAVRENLKADGVARSVAAARREWLVGGGSKERPPANAAATRYAAKASNDAVNAAMRVIGRSDARFRRNRDDAMERLRSRVSSAQIETRARHFEVRDFSSFIVVHYFVMIAIVEIVVDRVGPLASESWLLFICDMSSYPDAVDISQLSARWGL
ncbi:hypothetical protein Scep_025280 [Stephania cephalantha]|uniref:Uncharacterized protein n=1 Tax=Stephania cephalantha TaxID=152367 RepID=A0AAP0HRE7_9MAGN